MIENLGYLGEFHIYQVINIIWHSSSANAAALDRTVLGVMQVFYEEEITPLKILHLYDKMDHDNIVGVNLCEIVIGINYEYIGKIFNLVLKDCTLDGETVSANIATFKLVDIVIPERYYPAMRKLVTPKVLINE